MSFLKKLSEGRIWKRIFYERLTEPLHLNAFSLFAAIFGSYRMKIALDLVVRQHNAYCILKSADQARQLGIRSVTLIEFGVATGAGLFNMAQIAKRISSSTGIEFRIYGFDSGKGMPQAIGYQDHPEYYKQGDYPMDYGRLKSILPANTKLIIGDINQQSIQKFITENVSREAPIGYVNIDVDYYSSARESLKIFLEPAEKYLPVTYVYFDDIEFEGHNSRCGELLAVEEFNRDNPLRFIERHSFLENQRIFKKANWIKHIFALQVLDHPVRNDLTSRPDKPSVLNNPYL